MDREKLSRLEIWESYKYSELCTLLGETEKQRNSKKAQEREWARNFEYIKKGEKKGLRYFICDIYDEEKRKTAAGNSKYVKMIESVLSYVLIGYCETTGKDEVEIITDWRGIAYTLYMLNSNAWRRKTELRKIAKKNGISMSTFNAFIHADRRYIQSKIERTFNDMKKNKEIVWWEIHVGLCGEEYRKLTDSEYLQYAEIEKDVIREMVPDCKNTGVGFWTIIRQDKQDVFYNEVDNRAMEKLNICSVFAKYEIHTRKRLMMYAAERITALEYSEALQKLNNEICVGLRESRAMLCVQRNKMYTGNGKYTVIGEKNQVTEQERDYLVGLVHGLDGEEFAAGRKLRELRNELDVHIENRNNMGIAAYN